MEQAALSREILIRLRSSGLINENEVAYAEGDLHIAKDVITGEKRIIIIDHILTESRKTLLKG